MELCQSGKQTNVHEQDDYNKKARVVALILDSRARKTLGKKIYLLQPV